MKINTSTWRNFDIEIDGATLTCKAFDVRTKLSAAHVEGELAVLGKMDFYRMSRASQDIMVDTVLAHVVDWRGVKNEQGVELAFEPELIERFFPSITLMSVYFRMLAAARVSEDQLKNSSSASRSGAPAPVISTAESASNSVHTPAENPAVSVIGMAAA